MAASSQTRCFMVARSIGLGVRQLQLDCLALSDEGDRPGGNCMHTPLIVDVLTPLEWLAKLRIHRNQCSALAGTAGNHTEKLEAFLNVR